MRATGQAIPEQEARETAARFLAAQGAGMQKAALTCTYTGQDNDAPLYYIFNGEQAFVLVAAERSAPPVLAYSTRHTFNRDSIAPAMKMWMESYRRQLQAIRDNGTARASAGEKGMPGIVEEVEPLMESRWGQGMAFNYFCPKDDNGKNERCVTGCVATAMAQLMYYFRWPETGTGSYRYTHDTYGELSADFGSSRYEYHKMCDRPVHINAAISQLCHHSGVAVDMVYGPGASGMYNHKAAYALRTYFKYSPKTQYIFRDSNGLAHDSLHPTPTPLDWDSVVVAHLQRRIPLYYAGWSKPWTDGHGFICDGYQKDSSGRCFFHFNFGWEGVSDGYFYTGSLNPGSHNFNLAQEVIINAVPDTAAYSYPPAQPATGETLLTHRSGSFRNGGNGFTRCTPGMDHTWHIRPDLDSISGLNLQLHVQLLAGDTLRISSTDKGFNGMTLTATDTAFQLSTSIAQADIRLTTAAESRSIGFHASYEAVWPEFCTTTRPSTKTTATLSDGSGDLQYNHNTCCRTIINLKGYDGMNLKIHYLETEKGRDLLRFYDYNDSNRLLLELSGRLDNDSDFFLPSNFVIVEFVSDDSIAGEGWSFTYTASKTTVTEAAAERTRLWPNPAQSELRIENLSGRPIGEIRLTDLTGRLLLRQQAESGSCTLPVAGLPQGLYLLHIRGEQGAQVLKFVKE
ncbi:MAG: C10 family peptidase [Bacteroidales bacterium]|nr:C10 family peptidase [Bacteroidales bacterium]